MRIAVAAIMAFTVMGDGSRQLQSNFNITVVDTGVTDSAQCTQDCLGKGSIFCRYANDRSTGDCCRPTNYDCLSNSRVSICSNLFKFDGYKVFSCPYEQGACGSRNDYVLSSDSYIASIQSTPLFKRNKVCYYTLSGPIGAANGDLLYLKVIQNLKVKSVITMALDMNDQTPKVVCNMDAGNVIVARHPQKFFVSFAASETDGTAFFFTAYYSKTPT